MNELDAAVKLSERVLDKPYIDPDGDIYLLARQLLRMTEENVRLTAEVRRLQLAGTAPA